MKKNYNIKQKLGRLLVIIFLSLFIIIIMIPLLWMLSLTFKQPFESTEAYFFLIPKNIKLDNYKIAIEYTNGSFQEGQTYHNMIPIQDMFKNSGIVTTTSVILTIIVGSIGAYAFSKLKFKGKNLIFNLVLLSMMLPLQAIIIPVFMFSSYIHLLDNYLALILAYTAVGLPLCIFILRGFFSQVPDEIREAAHIDGASEFGIFLKIMIPISRPALATVVILLFLQYWNEFLLALVLLMKKSLWTIPVALSKLIGEYMFPWEIYSALIFITSIPIIIVFVIFQNWFIKGLTAGAVKG